MEISETNLLMKMPADGNFLKALFLPLLLAAATAGCVVPSAPELRLTEKDDRGIFRIPNGRSAMIELESNPSTGYLWSFSRQGVAVEFVGESFTAPQNNMPGAPGMTRCRIRAVAPGRSEISARYHRPWEKETPPERSWNCIIEVESTR